VPGGDRLEDTPDRPRPAGVCLDAWLGEGDRLPGTEDRAHAGGRLQQHGVLSGGDVEMSGDGRDVGDLRGRPQLTGGHVGQADVTDQPLLTQLGKGADLVLERGVARPGAVQVVQADPVDSQASGAHMGTLAQVAGVSDRVERRQVTPATDHPSLSGDQQVFWIGMESFADQQLAAVRPVNVGRVDKRDPRLDGLAQQRDRGIPVGVIAE
jgi:hypothetical protein